MNFFYKKNGLFVITLNDNGPVTVIPNANTDVPHASAKWCNPGTKAYIGLDHSNCTTEDNKQMVGANSLDAMAGVYRTDVPGNK